MGNIAEYKLHLIQLISAIDNEDDLEWLEYELEKLLAGKKDTPKEATNNEAKEVAPSKSIESKFLKKPYRKKFDPEAMMREQGWTGQHDREGMMRLIKEMDIQEPVEELLAMLTK